MPARKPEEVQSLFTDAFNAGRIDDLVALYEDDAAFATGPDASVTGKAAIREALKGFLAMKLTLRYDSSAQMRAGDVALLQGRWTMSGKGQTGEPMQMTGTSREVVRRQPDGTWLYAIDDPGGGR
jgi:uncharacterized protein (TIGR02246 family)